jgi:homopolymeric O-antigen transport system ATP-binding protein
MDQAAIEVEGLGKSYALSDSLVGRRTLRDTLTSMPRWVLRRFLANEVEQKTAGLFWALKDVSFTVQPGEIVGVMGRNGAGKSTLLKILSRITKPTEGSVRFLGRVSSLLEVGTGFHPELTGRENIFLNGSMIGMRRAEIIEKFDEIVAFSGVEQFLDTPVKYYSSGMYVRLAFSVAAHLEPEILIVDEVLAVGDAEFQAKCLGKIRSVVRDHGRTVLFVSHNINAILQLCSKCILLEGGRLTMVGPVEDVAKAYTSKNEVQDTIDLVEHPNRAGSFQSLFRRLEMFDAQDRPCSSFAPHTEVRLKLSVTPREPILAPSIGVGITNWLGERICAVATYLSPWTLPPIRDSSSILARFTLPALVPGKYSLDISISDGPGKYLDEIHAAGVIEVPHTTFLESRFPMNDYWGAVMVRSDWELAPQASEPRIQASA